MKKVALSEVKDDLSKYLRVAEKEGVVITRHGKPAGILVGFKSEEDWFDYCPQKTLEPALIPSAAAKEKGEPLGSPFCWYYCSASN